jgi:glyoxylate carboligase
MAKMRAVDAAAGDGARGNLGCFRRAGAAINPLYSALHLNGSIRHILARHVEGLGCKAIRIRQPGEFKAAFARAQELMAQYQVPVVLECIMERVTNISMGADLDSVQEFEELPRAAAARTPRVRRPNR